MAHDTIERTTPIVKKDNIERTYGLILAEKVTRDLTDFYKIGGEVYRVYGDESVRSGFIADGNVKATLHEKVDMDKGQPLQAIILENEEGGSALVCRATADEVAEMFPIIPGEWQIADTKRELVDFYSLGEPVDKDEVWGAKEIEMERKLIGLLKRLSVLGKVEEADYILKARFGDRSFDENAPTDEVIATVKAQKEIIAPRALDFWQQRQAAKFIESQLDIPSAMPDVEMKKLTNMFGEFMGGWAYDTDTLETGNINAGIWSKVAGDLMVKLVEIDPQGGVKRAGDLAIEIERNLPWVFEGLKRNGVVTDRGEEQERLGLNKEV